MTDERMKMALFGDFTLTMEVAALLRARQADIVYVNDDEDEAERARDKGIRTAEIDYTDDQALRSIGIGSDIGKVFCLFLEDSKNVFLTISARAIDPELTIVSITQSRESEQKLLAAGASKTVDPYRLSGKRIFDQITRPAVIDLIDDAVFGEQELDVAELHVSRGSFLDGVDLDELSFKGRYNLVLLGVVDRELGPELIFRTQGVRHRLDENDVLVVIGPRAEIEALRRDL